MNGAPPPGHPILDLSDPTKVDSIWYDYLVAAGRPVAVESGSTNPGATGATSIPTVPPDGDHPVTNLYVNSAGQLRVEFEDGTSIGLGQVTSNPPAGEFRVTNLYVEAATGRLRIEYDDTPVA